MNNGNNAVNNYLKKNQISPKKHKIEIIIVAVILFICIVLLVIVIRNAVSFKNKVQRISPFYLKDPVRAESYQLSKTKVNQNQNTGNYGFTLWIYIENYSYKVNNKKILFQFGNKDSIYLTPTTNNLVFSSSNQNCIVDNIPIQKWVNITILVKSLFIDIYINGRLEKTCKLRTVQTPLKNISIPQGPFYGQISNIRYFNNKLSYQDVQQIYQNGPN